MAGLPEVARVYKRYSPRGLMVIGVHDASGKTEEIGRAIRELGVPYPVMRDIEARKTFSGYQIRGVPHLLLVGKDGKILADGKSLKEMEKLIQQRLGAP